MKLLAIVLLFFLLNLNLYSQEKNLDKYSFKQMYSKLLHSNCDTIGYCSDSYKLKYQLDTTNLTNLYFNVLDTSFFKKIDTNIVIINENHLFPQNRVLIHKLINYFLADSNYYFFFEALNQDLYYNSIDTISIGKQYGFYLEEPQMAENIRLILNHHKNIYSYESTNKTVNWDKYNALGLSYKVSNRFITAFIKQTKSSSYYTSAMNIRDMNQFINFYQKYRVLKKKNTSAKFVIFCGWGHVVDNKRFAPEWFDLAYLIKKHITNPITIDISSLIDNCPHCKKSYERNKYYDKIIPILPNKNIFYSISRNNLKNYNLNTKIQASMSTDYLIYSPPIKYKNNRETWLQYDGKQAFLVDKKYYITNKRKKPVLKAYYKNENPKIATPADILYINKKEKNYFLLYKGKYDVYSNEKYIFTITIN